MIINVALATINVASCLREALDISNVANRLRKTLDTSNIASRLRKALATINVTSAIANIALATFFPRIKERLAIFSSRLYSIEKIFF